MLTNNIILRTDNNSFIYVTNESYLLLNDNFEEFFSKKFETKIENFLPVNYKNRLYLFHLHGVIIIECPETGQIRYVSSSKTLDNLCDYTIFHESIYISGSFGVYVFNENDLRETLLKISESFLFSDDEGIFYQKKRIGLFACTEGFRIKKSTPECDKCVRCTLDSCQCCYRMQNNKLLLINNEKLIRSKTINLSTGEISNAPYRSLFNNGYFFKGEFYEVERDLDGTLTLLRNPAPEFIDSEIITLTGEEVLH